MLDSILAALSALAYGVAPIVYRPALLCTTQFRAMSIFSLFSIALGVVMPWKSIDAHGVVLAVAAGLLGGVAGSWMYITAIKIGGASVGNISSSMYIVLLPVASGRLWLWPAAALVLLGVAIASLGDKGSARGAPFGLAAAAIWTVSIMFYAAAVETLGVGGALFTRGVVVFTVATLLSVRAPLCEVRRLAAGGFVDTFVGFGAYTYAVSLGDFVKVTIITSTYPLVTSLLERPVKWRRVLGAAVAFIGVLYVFI